MSSKHAPGSLATDRAVAAGPFALSDKLRFMSAVAVLSVVTLHSQNTKLTQLTESGPAYDVPLLSNAYAQEWICTWLLRSGMPLLTVTSGFLFFAATELSWATYRRKVTTRVRTLLIPFVFWSAAVIALYWALQAITPLTPLFERPLLRHYTVEQLLTRTFVDPMNRPVYFLRDLMAIVLLTPIIAWCLRRPWAAVLLLVGTGVAWWTHTLLRPLNERLLFHFCVGGALAYYHQEPWLRRVVAILRRGPVLLALASTWLFATALGTVLQHSAGGYQDWSVASCSVLLGIPVLWLAFDRLPATGVIVRTLDKISPYNFILFAAHSPFVNFTKKALLLLLPAGDAGRFFVLVSTPVVAVSALMCMALVLERFAPAVYSVVTGGRAERAEARAALARASA